LLRHGAKPIKDILCSVGGEDGYEICKLLVEAKADLNFKCFVRHLTPLDCAIDTEEQKIGEYL